MQVVAVVWMIATIYFLVLYTSPCQKLPPRDQLKYFEQETADQDIFSGDDSIDDRKLKHFPRLWCDSYACD